MKKTLIYTAIILPVLGVALSSIYFFSYYQIKISIQSKQTSEGLTTKPSTFPEIPNPPNQSGVIDEPVVVDTVTQQSSALIKMLPYKTSAFAIDIDYGNDVFVVTVGSPNQANYQIFQKWLKDYGFDQIPQEKFRVSYQ